MVALHVPRFVRTYLNVTPRADDRRLAPSFFRLARGYMRVLAWGPGAR